VTETLKVMTDLSLPFSSFFENLSWALFLPDFPHCCLFNRGADQRRVPRKQAQLDCVVRGVRSSTLFWRKAPGQGT